MLSTPTLPIDWSLRWCRRNRTLFLVCAYGAALELRRRLFGTVKCRLGGTVAVMGLQATFCYLIYVCILRIFANAVEMMSKSVLNLFRSTSEMYCFFDSQTTFYLANIFPNEEAVLVIIAYTGVKMYFANIRKCRFFYILQDYSFNLGRKLFFFCLLTLQLICKSYADVRIEWVKKEP